MADRSTCWFAYRRYGMVTIGKAIGTQTPMFFKFDERNKECGFHSRIPINEAYSTREDAVAAARLYLETVLVGRRAQVAEVERNLAEFNTAEARATVTTKES